VIAAPNVNTYNNLGITLFYLGRSDDALRRLNEGIALDPSYQRIWLTLGFVNGQLGNFREARTALNRAVGMGADNEIGQSAMQMLDGLPREPQ
jgi:Flp pilus assembly protein TadD